MSNVNANISHQLFQFYCDCLRFGYKNKKFSHLIAKLMYLLLIRGVKKMSSASGVIANSIKSKLQTALQTKHLDVINESYMHNVPKGAETHFKVVVVSSQFEGLPLIKRHRLVNETLKEELQNGVHALSIIAKTPEQWESSDQIVESSPNCRGGFGK